MRVLNLTAFPNRLRLLCVAVAASCGGGDSSIGPTSAPVPATTIRVAPGNLTLNVGGAGTLTATVADASGAPVPNAAVSWQSRNAAIASVSNGNVVAIAVGQTTVIASTGGKSDSALVVVQDNLTLTIVPPSATVNVGKTVQLNVAARNSAGQTVPTPPVSWTSSDPTIATINASGVATGVAKGGAMISVAATGATMATASLTVNDSARAAPTPIGTPNGPIVSAVIGSSGGRVASGDGILALDIPAGALTSTVIITLQPVTNTAPGGFSSTYQFGPEGQTFAKPFTLTFTYPSDVVAGADFSLPGSPMGFLVKNNGTVMEENFLLQGQNHVRRLLRRGQ